jgi:hypothetical protein
MRKRYFALASVILISTVLSSAISTVSFQSNGGYDPWIDLNDDGTIDIFDIVAVALAFGASGTPINKTALLLGLQDRVDALNATITLLEDRVASLEGQATTFCAEISHYTTQSWTPPPASINANDIKVDFPVTFTTPANVQLSASGTVTTGTCAGYPFRVTGQTIAMDYAVLSLQGWNGASWVNLASGDEVDVSYVAIEYVSG